MMIFIYRPRLIHGKEESPKSVRCPCCPCKISVPSPSLPFSFQVQFELLVASGQWARFNSVYSKIQSGQKSFNFKFII
ncbi:hypothetical protein Pyn_08097 [Prunus yedoensis var. nudiflora]|uniref:Uncharacterized protein n=1 Tax=Prunus yedoensis var. nudiflora TaxID=2094558 RepID=A0A314XVY4_PRUYE|nr:hypothetical protein Pyn_08097 [Prunus yedoensis var. nudiflora]